MWYHFHFEMSNKQMAEEVELEQNERLDMLERIILKVADEEGFTPKELPSKFKKHFQPIDIHAEDRCGDGREVLEEINGKSTGFKNATYNGPQSIGATPGRLDVTKKVAKISEDDSRFAISRAYIIDSRKMAAHSDDDHGHVNSLEDLEDKGIVCGNQNSKADNKLPMYPKGSVDRPLIKSRTKWFGERRSPIIPLAKAHTEKLANANLDPDTTFNNHSGVSSNESIFNCDIVPTADLAKTIHEVIVNNGLDK